MDEIINKVAQSSLEVFDLEDFYPKESIEIIDISQWLEEGFFLKEKEFRNSLKNYDFSFYHNKLVGLYCSTEAILPAWAYLVVATNLVNITEKVIQGNKKDVLNSYYQEQLSKVNFSEYQDKSVILKGCSKKEVPQEVYVLAISYLQKYAKSIMFGEACSAVPVFKRIK